MIKVVSTSLIFIALFGSSPRLFAQASAASAAEQAASAEAVRREARKVELRRVLSEAQALQARGELAAAAKAYEEAYELVRNIGTTIDRETEQTVNGMTEVRMELATRAQGRNDLGEADAQVSRVLRVNPRFEPAIEFKAKNDKLIQERLGKEPSKEVLQLVPEIRREHINTDILVNDARLLMEMGKLDEAELKLKQAVKQNPEHRAAFYYLSQIKERRYNQEARKREILAKEKIVEVEQAWNVPPTREALPMANPYARTNIVHTGRGRQAIQRKLEGIVLDQWFIPGDIPLSEVIKELDTEVKKRDVDRRGLNFIISSHLDRPGPAPLGAAAFGGFPQVDPLTGQPVAPTTTEAPVVVEDFLVKIDPPLKNVRLIDVLDAIVKVAKPPQGQSQNVSIKYSIEEYAIVFSQKQAEAEQLYTRTFRVDPNTFISGLDGVFLQANPFQQYVSQVGGGGTAGGGGGFGGGQTAGQTAGGVGLGAFFQFSGSGGGDTAGGTGGGGGATAGQTGGGGILGVTLANTNSLITDQVRNFFIAAGIDFQTNQAGFAGGGGFGPGGQPAGPQKAIFFNDRLGVLFVRATLRDLDIIENAIRALNMPPPQVTIETRIAEISQRDNKAVGFDWYLGNFLAGDGKVGIQGGTAPSYSDSSTPANPQGTFPNPPIARQATDSLITSGLRNNASIPAVGTISGILTDPQFRLVIRALEQREGVDLLSAPKITTLSGRQARISIEDTQTIIVGFNVQGLGGGGVVGGGVGGVGGVGVTTGGFTQ